MRKERNWLLFWAVGSSIAATIRVITGPPLPKWAAYLWFGSTAVWAWNWWMSDRLRVRMQEQRDEARTFRDMTREWRP